MTNLDELEALERKATKGPWRCGGAKDDRDVCDVWSDAKEEAGEYDRETGTYECDSRFPLDLKPNADFIVALRNEAVPMIQELRFLREHKETVESAQLPYEMASVERDALRAELLSVRDRLDEFNQSDKRESECVGAMLQALVALRAEVEKVKKERDFIMANTNVALATAREDALEEAAKACVKIPAVKGVVHEHYEQGYNNAVDDAVERIRALKATKGGGA